METKMFGKTLEYLFLVLCFGPVMFSVSSKVETSGGDCQKINAEECLENLQTFLRLTILPFTSDKQELDGLCKQALNGYNCSRVLYNGDCLPPKQKEMLPVFISSAEFMYLMICGNNDKQPGYLRDAFLGNSECVLENKEKMDCCAKETHIPEMPVLHIIEESSKSLTEREFSTCCPLSRYLECTSAVARENCGEFVANFTHQYIRRAAGEQVQAVCQNMPDYPHPDANTCPDPAPTCSGCQKSRLQYYMLIAVLFALLTFVP